MRITELEPVEFPPRRDIPPRSSGVHLTDVLHDMAEQIGLTHTSDLPQAKLHLLMEVGFLWEDLFSLAFSERTPVRPPELVKDGIACSPDGITVWDGKLAVVEYKCTRTSYSKPLEQRWMWIMQVKAYCHVLHSTTALFHVLYLNGNYRDDRGPTYKVYLVEFDPEETQAAWDVIVKHARSKGWIKEAE